MSEHHADTHNVRNTGGPNGDPITGTLLFGDPSQACGGTGICHMTKASATGPATIPGIQVALSTNNSSGQNANLVIAITADDLGLGLLQQTDYQIYNMLRACLSTSPPSNFIPAVTSLPFFIDSAVVASLWPAMAVSNTPNAFIPASVSGWTVAGSIASGIVITIPSILFSATHPIPGTVIVSSTSLRIGNWTIQTDAFGSLIFTSMKGTVIANQIVFGANGNLSVNASDVVTDNSPIYITNTGNDNAVLSATTDGAFYDSATNEGCTPDGWAGSTYWQTLTSTNNDGVDQDANMTIHIGNPFPTA